LLDSLTIAYLITSLEKQDDEFEDKIKRICQRTAKEQLKNIENINNPLEKQQYFELVKIVLPNHFGQNIEEGLINNIKEISPKQMADSLQATNLDWFNQTYVFYSYYSKYEHFIPLTKNMLMHNPEYEFDKLVVSSSFIFYAAYLSLIAIKSNQDYIDNQLKLYNEFANIKTLFVN
jgi:hypothetical protein